LNQDGRFGGLDPSCLPPPQLLPVPRKDAPEPLRLPDAQPLPAPPKENDSP
jgi:hypothetical protein